MQIKEMLRRAIGPTLHVLLVGHRFHHSAQKVTAVSTIAHHGVVDIFFRKACLGKQRAVIPGVQHRPAMAGTTQVSEARLKDVENLRLRPIDGEVSRREKHVVEERCSRTWTSNDKNWSLTA